jgi:hypothetical protein
MGRKRRRSDSSDDDDDDDELELWERGGARSFKPSHVQLPNAPELLEHEVANNRAEPDSNGGDDDDDDDVDEAAGINEGHHRVKKDPQAHAEARQKKQIAKRGDLFASIYTGKIMTIHDIF